LVSRETDGKRTLYKLTDKGYSVLHLYKDLKGKLDATEGPLPRKVELRPF
jgi:predicted transcriptional regulator